MSAKLDAKLATLATLSPAELSAAWQRAYGATPPRLSPELMRLGIDYRWQEKALGGLPSGAARTFRQAVAALGVGAAAPAASLRPGTRLAAARSA